MKTLHDPSIQIKSTLKLILLTDLHSAYLKDPCNKYKIFVSRYTEMIKHLSSWFSDHEQKQTRIFYHHFISALYVNDLNGVMASPKVKVVSCLHYDFRRVYYSSYKWFVTLAKKEMNANPWTEEEYWRWLSDFLWITGWFDHEEENVINLKR